MEVTVTPGVVVEVGVVLAGEMEDKTVAMVRVGVGVCTGVELVRELGLTCHCTVLTNLLSHLELEGLLWTLVGEEVEGFL